MQLKFYTDGKDYIIEFPTPIKKFVFLKQSSTCLSFDDKDINWENCIIPDGYKPIDFSEIESYDQNELKNSLNKYLTCLEQRIIARNFFPDKNGQPSILSVYFANSENFDKARVHAISKFGKEVLIVYKGMLHSAYTKEEYDAMSSWGRESFCEIIERTKKSSKYHHLISNLKISYFNN